MSEDGGEQIIAWEGGKNNTILDTEALSATKIFDTSLTQGLQSLLAISEQAQPETANITPVIKNLLTDTDGQAYNRDQLHAIEDFWGNLGTHKLDYSEQPSEEQRKKINSGDRKFREAVDAGLGAILEGKGEDNIQSEVVKKIIKGSGDKQFTLEQIKAIKTFWNKLEPHGSYARNEGLPPGSPNPNDQRAMELLDPNKK